MSEISAVIITFNEESYIEKCLESLKGIADEIVVVDSLSTDSTEKICKRYNTRFIKHEFEGYMEQKNYAVSQAKYKYVLSLDADEALSDKLRGSILKIKDNIRYDCYYFLRRNNYCGKWMIQSIIVPDRHTRLFDRSKGTWKGLNPHDKFIPEAGARIKKLKGDLLHWNYASFDEHRNRMDHYSTIAAGEYFKIGKKAGPLTGAQHMIWRFFRSYILEGGFLNGYKGYVFCKITAMSSFLKYSKLRRLNIMKKDQ
jgi:glycosyltransferase involved in cell wall biosynthesis